MKYTFTFQELVEIFKHWQGDLSGYELACKFIDCLCDSQKKTYLGELQEGWRGREMKG